MLTILRTWIKLLRVWLRGCGCVAFEGWRYPSRILLSYVLCRKASGKYFSKRSKLCCRSYRLLFRNTVAEVTNQQFLFPREEEPFAPEGHIFSPATRQSRHETRLLCGPSFYNDPIRRVPRRRCQTLRFQEL